MPETPQPRDAGPAPTDPLVRKYRPTAPVVAPAPVREIGGRRDGPEPTRYGDWEKDGRCIDF